MDKGNEKGCQYHQSTDLNEHPTRRTGFPVIIPSPTRHLQLARNSAGMLHAAAHLNVISTPVRFVVGSRFPIGRNWLQPARAPKLLPLFRGHGIFQRFQRSRRMIDLSPANDLSADFEAARERSSAADLNEHRSRRRRRLPSIVVPPAFYGPAADAFAAGVLVDSVAMGDGARMEETGGEGSLGRRKNGVERIEEWIVVQVVNVLVFFVVHGGFVVRLALRGERVV